MSLTNHVKEKHLKYSYNRATDGIRSAFTPMVCTPYGVLHSELLKKQRSSRTFEISVFIEFEMAEEFQFNKELYND